MTSDKTPGQLAYEAYHESLSHRVRIVQWDFLKWEQVVRDDWELAALAVHQPLLDRIAELEKQVESRTFCRCGTKLDLLCSDIGCDSNKTDYAGHYIYAAPTREEVEARLRCSCGRTLSTGLCPVCDNDE